MSASLRDRQLAKKAGELRVELELASTTINAILGAERAVRSKVHVAHPQKAAKGRLISPILEKASEEFEQVRGRHRKAGEIGSRRVDVREQYVVFGRQVAEAYAKAEELHEELLKTFDVKDFSPSTFDPRQAGRQAVAQMQEAEGGAWTGKELKKRFELTPATLHKRRKDLRIVWWRDAKNKFHYPKWQFRDNGTLLPGVAEVLQIFRSQDEWRVMRYFLSHRHQLGDQTPLDLLLKGDVDKVLAHAKLHGEENTW